MWRSVEAEGPTGRLAVSRAAQKPDRHVWGPAVCGCQCACLCDEHAEEEPHLMCCSTRFFVCHQAAAAGLLCSTLTR